jgi:CubicO group peptidase (beta-lactamase class C family)
MTSVKREPEGGVIRSPAPQAPGPWKLALGLPASDEPVGEAFKYNQCHPLLLGLILERTTGRTVSAYTSEKIWQPLGTELPATWSLDSTKHGFEKMESGLNGRAIDFAKFGSLFLHEGTWNGHQVISEQWVIESTAPDPGDARPWLSHQDWKNAGGYYKYQWWGIPREGGGLRVRRSGPPRPADRRLPPGAGRRRTVWEDRRPGRLLGRGGEGYCGQAQVHPSWVAVPALDRSWSRR